MSPEQSEFGEVPGAPFRDVGKLRVAGVVVENPREAFFPCDGLQA